MSKQSAFCIIILMLLIFRCTPSIADINPDQLSKAKLEVRLNYLVGLQSFSNRHPLTQKRLMKLVLSLTGEFPKQFTHLGSPPEGCDEYITHTMASRFTQSLVGQSLSVWTYENNGPSKKLVGDKLCWSYNSSNSMYEAPKIHLIKMRDLPGHSQSAQFRITYKDGNVSDNPPAKEIATGIATLKRVGSNWLITSWQVTRNRQWNTDIAGE